MSVLIRICANRLLNLYPVHKNIVLLSTTTDVEAPTKKKRKPLEVRINVIENSTLTVMSKESAMKLANRRNMILSAIENPATWMSAGKREPFELQSPSQKVKGTNSGEAKIRGFKGSKHVHLTAGIQEHDAAYKIKQIQKFLNSGYVTDVVIDSSEKTETLLEKVQEAVKDCAKPGVFKKKNKNIVKVEFEPSKTSSKVEPSSEENSEGAQS